MRDLHLAVRRLLKSPGFTIAAVLTLALGIGANTLAFSAVRAILVRPLPFRDAERLVWVYARPAAAPDAREKLDANETKAVGTRTTVFDRVAVFGDRAFRAQTGDRPSKWMGLWASPSLFDVLGVEMALGRPFSLDDARQGNSKVVTISYERWQRDFAGDSAIVGRVIELGEDRYTVVGVLPRGLAFPLGRVPQSGNGTGFRVGVQDFWILGQGTEGEYGSGPLIGRLRPGTTLASARAELESAAIGDRMLEAIPFREHVVGMTGPALRLLQGFTALVLLIACANLANLVLVRASTREREFAIRAALGAGRSVALRSLLVESLLLTLGGGVLGVLIAAYGRDALQLIAAGRVPLVETIELDGVVLLFTLASCAVTMVVCGVLPTTLAAGAPVHALMQSGGRAQTAGTRHTRLRNGLVVTQVALAVGLLVGAALVLQSLTRLLSVDAGYKPEHVLTADVTLHTGKGYMEYFRSLNEQLRSLPGVERVGIIQSTPLTGKWTFKDPFILPGETENTAKRVSGNFIAFDYFGAMGIPLLAGRAFTEAEYLDPKGIAPVVIINESAARTFFPGESPLGRTVTLAGTSSSIVGIVKDTRDARLDTAAEPQWYQPLFFEGAELMIRVKGDPAAMMATVRRTLLASDRRLIIDRLEPLDAVIASTVAERRLAVQLLAVFAMVALALASIGLYGVLSFGVAQRRREFGVRTALGARRWDVLRLVMRDGVGLTLVGIGIGLLLTVALGGALRSLLFGVSATDPVTFMAISVACVAVAIAASWMPAWRAATTDPMIALRED
jgi:putative ABC transport system permease protein